MVSLATYDSPPKAIGPLSLSVETRKRLRSVLGPRDEEDFAVNSLYQTLLRKRLSRHGRSIDQLEIKGDDDASTEIEEGSRSTHFVVRSIGMTQLRPLGNPQDAPNALGDGSSLSDTLQSALAICRGL
jgi:hypothetical protein